MIIEAFYLRVCKARTSPRACKMNAAVYWFEANVATVIVVCCQLAHGKRSAEQSKFLLPSHPGVRGNFSQIGTQIGYGVRLAKGILSSQQTLLKPSEVVSRVQKQSSHVSTVRLGSSGSHLMSQGKLNGYLSQFLHPGQWHHSRPNLSIPPTTQSLQKQNDLGCDWSVSGS